MRLRWFYAECVILVIVFTVVLSRLSLLLLPGLALAAYADWRQGVL